MQQQFPVNNQGQQQTQYSQPFQQQQQFNQPFLPQGQQHQSRNDLLDLGYGGQQMYEDSGIEDEDAAIDAVRRARQQSDDPFFG